jgi:hypothetical protein
MSPANSWHVTLDEKGGIQWRSAAGVRTTQPAFTTWQRISGFAFKHMPEFIEKQL